MAEAKKPTKESARARAACEQYLLLGPYRSLAKLCKALGHPPGYERTLKEWSAAFGWAKKAQEYDHEQALAKRQKYEAQLERMNEEHLLWGHAQALGAMEMIADLQKKSSYNLQSANQLFKVSTDMQRIAIESALRQIALKDGGAIQEDVIVRTFWGRGTDPRKHYDTPDTSAESAVPSAPDRDPEISARFGFEVPPEDDSTDQ